MAVHQLTCRGCGNQFTFHRRKAYCSVKCRSSVQPKGTDPHINAACRQEHTCNVCDKTFKPKRAGRTTVCSRACGFIWSGLKTTLKQNGGRVWVRSIRNRPEPIKLDPKVYYQPITDGTCRNCGASFDRAQSGGSMHMCSDACKIEAAQRCKRISRKKRKAVERGARVGHSVDPLVVFDRDGWRCQMCRRQTPPDKRGTYHKRAPELDHIMPLSLGGEHSYRNTQCLCRSCNAAKSNKPMGQLSLL